MESLFLSVQDWITITTAITVPLSPLYYYVWRLSEKWQQTNENLAQTNSHIAEALAVISNCPYCTRRGHE